MKFKLFYLCVIMAFVMLNLNAQAQLKYANNQLYAPFEYSLITEEIDTTKAQMGAMFGAITIDGQNYQQLGFLGDFPIGKLGFGLDIQISIDENGQIYKADWDEWHDYLDKIYYVRWAYKGAPFYFKLGGLDYSYMGYSNVINGYTNMVEFPTVKRWGLEMSFHTKDDEGNKKFGAELFINDFKELFRETPSMIFGTRISYRPFGNLELGFTYAGDYNEFNSLRDFDGDGIPDDIDHYKDDADWATQRDKLEYDLTQEIGITAAQTAVDALVNLPNDNTEKVDPIRKSQLFNLNDTTSKIHIVSADIGYPIIERSFIKLDIYSHFTKIMDYGWGTTMPGLRFVLGQKGFLTFKAEYRMSSEEFMFGYFDYTYEIQRAQFVQVDGNLQVKTKQQHLKDVTEGVNGIFVGMDINVFGMVLIKGSYQDLKGSDIEQRSIVGEFSLGKTLTDKLPVDAKGYYRQMNVTNFKEWKTPSTIMGAVLSYNLGGVDMGFDYRFTFNDFNGDGEIRGDNETIKTIGVKAGVKF